MQRCAWLMLCFICTAPVSAEDGLRFAVQAGASTRLDCPIAMEVPLEWRSAPALRLVDLESGSNVDVQKVDDRTAIWILSGPLPAGKSRRFELRKESPARSPAFRVTCIETQGLVSLNVDGRAVLSYHATVSEPPAGMDARYRRSGHLHPVRTPDGRVVTDEFPVDHPHQHGVFSAWVNTEFEGRKVDFWNQLGGTGTVEHRKILGMQSGEVFGTLSTELAHISLSAPEGPKDALIETWTIHAFAVSTGHLFEIDVVQRCASESPLTLKEYHYGGMAVRGSSHWLGQPEHDFLTSDGLHRERGNHSRPDWVNMHGIVDGEPCGMTIFSHPSNPRHPQPVRLHPQKPYFVFSPVVLGDLQIRPGQPYRARYLHFVKDGPTDLDELTARWRDYADPPRLVWE